MPTAAKFKYMNHRGEVSERSVMAACVEFLPNPSYGYQPGWFLSGDVPGKGRRSFALSRVVFDESWPNGHPVVLVRF